MKTNLKNVILSRTDSIGDVILTLPMAKVLKNIFPGIKIAFLGKEYTKSIIEACQNIDYFIDKEDFLKKEVLIDGQKPEAILHVFPNQPIAKRAKEIGIPWRIGSFSKIHHLLYCNDLVKLNRKNSAFHESQLNLMLIADLGAKPIYELREIAGMFGLTKIQSLPAKFQSMIDPNRFNLILHPKSQGSAREWNLENYQNLIQLLPPNKFKIFITGTAKEAIEMKSFLDAVSPRVENLCGNMTLEEFISFIHAANGMIACSTGPLHLAAVLGKFVFGIYPPIRPMHPGRWSPVGKNVEVFVKQKNCNACRKTKNCICINEITASEVSKAVIKAISNKQF